MNEFSSTKRNTGEPGVLSAVGHEGIIMTYELEWREFKKRRNHFFAALILFAVVPTLLPPLIQKFITVRSLDVIIGVGWIFIILLTWIRLITLKCPRCNKLFFFYVFILNPFTAKCSHCKLQMWSTDVGNYESTTEEQMIRCSSCGAIIQIDDCHGDACPKCNRSIYD